MKKILIFGAGSTGEHIYEQKKSSANVVGFLDNDPSCWNTEFNGLPVLGNDSVLAAVEYDEIFIASIDGLKSIKEQLLTAGVPAEKIRTNYFLEVQYTARINFLHKFAEINKENARRHAVAEGGVFQGEFAKEINSVFPDSTLYLFDTFEGFDKRDVNIEKENGYSNKNEHFYNATSEDLVLNKMPHKNKVIIRKGFFPETAIGLENTTYFFVNLDFDLYNPTIEGLRFFVPRLARGGVVLVHDYFSPSFLGVAPAVRDYAKECKLNLQMFPIGDNISIAIMVC